MIETYICSYTRSPIGAFQGLLSSVTATKLGSIVIKDVIDKIDLDNTLIDEVILNIEDQTTIKNLSSSHLFLLDLKNS